MISIRGWQRYAPCLLAQRIQADMWLVAPGTTPRATDPSFEPFRAPDVESPGEPIGGQDGLWVPSG